jgi:hypothetical protein
MLKEYALLLGTNGTGQSPSNGTQSVDDDTVSNASPQKPNALFQPQPGKFDPIFEAEEEMVDYEAEGEDKGQIDGADDEMEIDDDKAEKISIDNVVEKALEVNSSVDNDDTPQTTNTKQGKARTDQSSSVSSSDVSSSEEDSATEKHANQTKQKLRVPLAAVTRRRSARVANRGTQSGTDDESKTAQKSDSDVSDDSDEDVD